MVNFIREYLYMLDHLIISKVEELACLSILLEMMEDKIGISGENIVKGLIRAVPLFMMLAYGPTIFINTLVVFYPAYLSFQSIEYGDNDETTRWMKYWIVFGMVRAAENIGGPLIWWFPGYFIFKFLFLLWCLAPKEYNGAVMIYESYLRPEFLKHSETVDDFFRFFKNLSIRPLCRR